MPSDTLWSRDRKIVLAADVPTLEELRRLTALGKSVNSVVGIKVGFALALRFGLAEVVRVIREESDLPVIYDHQKGGTDIPQMGPVFAETCRKAGLQSIILFPLSGPRSLEAFVSAAWKCDLNPIIGCFMTHAAYVESEGGFISNDGPRRILESAVDMGVTNFVLPGTKPHVIKEMSRGVLSGIKPTNIMMPGIGTQGGSIPSSFEAAEGHHRIAIIGSAIYGSPDARAQLENFASQVEKCPMD